MKYALIGNQNSGKTTLYNALTGSNQRVGNFPGVTVESKIGIIKNSDIEIVDLPGIYSLSPFSNEEIVTRDYLINEDVDLIINIVDVTNIERNMYLTLQLLELNKPVVIALNMMDEMTLSGNSINVAELEKAIGVRCIPIAAAKNEGINALIDVCKEVSNNKTLPKVTDFCKEDSPIHRAIHSLMLQIQDHLKDNHIPERYAITQLLEGDDLMLSKLKLNENEKDLIGHVIKELEIESGYDSMTTIAMMRYEFIDNLSAKSVKRKNVQTKEQAKSNKIDKILTNKYLSFPIFFLIIGIVFFLTFSDYGGGYLQGLLDNLFTLIKEGLSSAMTSAGFNKVIISLLCDGIITGVGSVVSFLPVVVILFLLLSLLEDSGYMARIAFIMDRPLRKIGLSGKSFVPMLIGFGCSVPAVMSSRTLVSDKERKATLALIPFMPCSAKLPIFTALTAAFFKASVLWIIILYAASVLLGIFVIFIHHKITKSSSASFMMELPAYRFPTFRNSILLMWEKTKDFLHKAFTVIFVASLFIWFLSSFDYHFNFVTNIDTSLLATISKYIVYIFKPFGVSDWRVASSIITGLSAKEAVVSTIEILFGSTDSFIAGVSIVQLLAFMVFVLLYMPCFATLSIYAKETSWKKAILYMLSQTIFAFIVATLIYQIGALF